MMNYCLVAKHFYHLCMSLLVMIPYLHSSIEVRIHLKKFWKPKIYRLQQKIFQKNCRCRIIWDSWSKCSIALYTGPKKENLSIWNQYLQLKMLWNTHEKCLHPSTIMVCRNLKMGLKTSYKYLCPGQNEQCTNSQQIVRNDILFM